MSARNYGFDFKPFEGEIEFLNEGDSVFLDEDELKVLLYQDIHQEVLLLQ
jgi:hypothetical protein